MRSARCMHGRTLLPPGALPLGAHLAKKDAHQSPPVYKQRPPGCCGQLEVIEAADLQAELGRTGMSRRMRLLLTLRNSSLSRAAQVAADMVGSQVRRSCHSRPGITNVLEIGVLQHFQPVTVR